MRTLQTEWWIIDIPEEWQAEETEDGVSISDCDDVGSIDISAVKKEQGKVTEEDLREFAKDLIAVTDSPQQVSINRFSGLLFEYLEEGLAWREWYLACDDTLIYVTYHCEQSNRGLDDAAVDAIVSTLGLTEQ